MGHFDAVHTLEAIGSLRLRGRIYPRRDKGVRLFKVPFGWEKSASFDQFHKLLTRLKGSQFFPLPAYTPLYRRSTAARPHTIPAKPRHPKTRLPTYQPSPTTPAYPPSLPTLPMEAEPAKPTRTCA